jgi:hypothetical protein
MQLHFGGLVQFLGLKLIALTVAAIVARCSSIAAD